MKFRIRAAALAGVLVNLAVFSTSAFAGNTGFSLTSGVDYSSGKYGAGQNTNILFVPLTGKYQSGPWGFSLSAPFVYISAPASPTHRGTEHGLGDVAIGSSYDVYAETGPDPWLVSVSGKIKFGTAAASKDLGTGANDYILSADVFKTFGLFTAFGGFGHKFAGRTAALQQKNAFFGSVGGAYYIGVQTSIGLLYDQRGRSGVTGAPQSSFTEFVSHKINSDWKATGYLVQGLTRASPDWGLGVNIKRSF